MGATVRDGRQQVSPPCLQGAVSQPATAGPADPVLGLDVILQRWQLLRQLHETPQQPLSPQQLEVLRVAQQELAEQQARQQPPQQQQQQQQQLLHLQQRQQQQQQQLPLLLLQPPQLQLALQPWPRGPTQTEAVAQLLARLRPPQLQPSLQYAGVVGLPTAAGWGLMQQQPQLYLLALARGQAIMAHNWQAATNRQRDAAWAQFDQWSWQQLGKPGQYCHPHDLVVYLESSFLRQHGRQVSADGSSCPAPSTVSSTVAHLSTRFQQLGCRGPWDWVANTGNPCNSMEMRTFKGGYANTMQESGFSPTAAKPISEAKLQQLVQCLAAEAAVAQQQRSQPWHVAVLLWRDACIAQYLWDSKRRPAELSQTQTAQVAVESSAVGSSSVQARPQVSKMCHASRGNRLPRPVEVKGPAGQQLAQLLLQYSQCVQQSGRSLGRYLFSPLHPSRQALQTEQGLSTAAMGQRVIGHLRRLGLYEGESLYSIKRGAMQHDFFVAGQSLQAIGTAADIDTSAVVQAYIDPTRHL